MNTNLEDRRRLNHARRMATRNRVSVACAPCKRGKAKCSDYRPCARCCNLGINNCLQDLEIQSSLLSRNISPTESRSFGSCQLGALISAECVQPYNSNLTSQSWTNMVPHWPQHNKQSPISAVFVPVFPTQQFARHGSLETFPHEPYQVPFLHSVTPPVFVYQISSN